MIELSNAAANQAAAMVLTRRSAATRPVIPMNTHTKTPELTHENSKGTVAGEGPRENGLSQGRRMRKKGAMLTFILGDWIKKNPVAYRPQLRQLPDRETQSKMIYGPPWANKPPFEVFAR